MGWDTHVVFGGSVNKIPFSTVNGFWEMVGGMAIHQKEWTHRCSIPQEVVFKSYPVRFYPILFRYHRVCHQLPPSTCLDDDHWWYAVTPCTNTSRRSDLVSTGCCGKTSLHNNLGAFGSRRIPVSSILKI